ncbi:MAG: pyridoxamine 5'-phosphate oxidase family protein, partial [Ktedonobacteraceae bacterium]|nr:pyridoxamine 5'-phosphate oxidase family protein [Ktedonobacteraceae bacterium]
RPHLVPVWFLWNGEDEILIFSQPENQKIRNMRQNNRVVLALEALKGGDDVVLLDGRAEIITDPEVKATMAAYVEKYGARLQEMNWKIEDMAQSYSQAIRITLTHIKSWNE